MDKETFDKKVATIWSLYDATKTLNDAGIGTRATSESSKAAIIKGFAWLGTELGDRLLPVGK